MEVKVKEMINKISSIKEEIYNYIINTEHWLFYWIENKEVQDFIKAYPEDYDNKVHLQVGNISHSPSFVIKFDDHPNDIKSIERYGVLCTFRNAVKAKWLEWNGRVKERQINEKEKELAYHKRKVGEIEKAILELKNQ
jgi:hypothetical protein